MIEPAVRRRIVRLLVAVVLLIVAYWVAWYADRSLVASSSRAAYEEFENAFPLADGWLAFATLAAAWSLRRRSPLALLWLLCAGSAGLYLFGMDVLYDLENGIWWSSGSGGGIELAINILTLTLSSWILWWSWRHREALLRG